MRLDRIPSGSRVFVDSTIFIYHFTAASADCRRFLERCERGEVKGTASAVVLAEVAHRLMMIEAVARGFLRPGNMARKLRARPDIVTRLETYREQVERIPLMGITVFPLEVKTLLHSHDVRRKYGLLVNDSLVAATAMSREVDLLATADSDFRRVTELQTYEPGDLGPAGRAEPGG